MEEDVKSLVDYWNIIRRRKKLVIVPTLILLLITVVVALVLPPVYQSQATILIEQQHIPTDLVKSTVVSFADERIKQIEQKVMTVDNVTKIIEKYSLYPEQKDKVANFELAEEFRKNTVLTLINANVVSQGRDKKATLAFSLSFSHKNAIVAQKITNEIVTLYLAANIKNRTERAIEATKFLEEEADKFKLEIQKIENQIADYKEKYSDSLPELLAANTSAISRTESELQQLDLRESMLNERRINLRNQLSLTSPNIIMSDNSNNIVESLSSLETQYSYLLGKYSAMHPDVKAIKRKIDNVARSSSATKENIAQNINNPVYLQLQSEIEISGLELQNISQHKQKLRNSLKEIEVRVSQTHQVERGYYDLMRDLDNQRLKYKELKSKALEAKLSQTLEEEQKAEKFSLIEPARVPSKPEKPNRFKILVLGFVLSIGIGLGLALLAEMLDSSIRGHKQLERVTGIVPIAVIPYIKNQNDKDQHKKNKKQIAMLAIILVVGAIVATHFLYQPLDILWFKVWHRISMI
ncbi:hypothetical protein AU255_03760 [Methyloprofundus sedimenti]|uniref:Polysaccharide chain length determinant N-terminal domain-containing protein n=1 Tax=Methyloprofundus sedimenti TaxID=1420851 RepID=A0A1V8M644_9GAMM|nr:Wzz/FepE/Etk N-terminal domain-containing protein [Methyloprofundus sedimenti]OQK17025.1 hypothetical protein AU255_03760 [Methyloprofundus sedimenti]